MYRLRELVKKSKNFVNKKNIIFVLLALLTWIVYSTNTNNPDYSLLEQRYYSVYPQYFVTKPLYGVLVWLFNSIHLPYSIFVCITSLFAITLFARYVYIHSYKKEFVWILYLIYPFLLDVVQTTNFLSFAIVLQSLDYLSSFNKKSVAKFTFGIIFASLIHPSSILYLLFLLAYIPKMTVSKILKIDALVVIILICGIALVPLLKQLGVFSGIITQLSYYLLFKPSYIKGTILYLALVLFLLGSCLFLRFKLTNNWKEIRDDFQIKILFIMLCFIPLLLVGSEFVRYIRNMWIIAYCYLSGGFKLNGNDKMIFISVSIIICAILFYKELFIFGNYFESVTIPILSDNLFSNLISFK